MVTRIPRPTTVGRCLLLASVIALFMLIAPSAFADVAPPTGVSISEVASQKSKLIKWTAPAGASEGSITKYTVRLGDKSVAVQDLYLGTIKTSAVVRNDDLAGGGNITVTATYTSGEESPRSDAVEATNVPGPNPADFPTPDQVAAANAAINGTPQPAQATNGIFGGNFGFPGLPDASDQPNGFELYGQTVGFQKVIDTYSGGDAEDLLNSPLNGLAVAIWQVSAILIVGGPTLLRWVLSNDTYGDFGLNVATVAAAISATQILKWILGLSFALLLWWLAYKLFKRSLSLVYKAMAWGFVILAVSVAYLTALSEIVPKVVAAPVTATQYTVSAMNAIKTPGTVTEETVGLKGVTGTYNGDPLQEAVRQYNYNNWLPQYQAWCNMNLGSADSMKLTIPNSDDLPDYKDLTACQFLLKAQSSNDEAALDYLRSDNPTLGVGGKVGEIEKLSPDMWKFYQGKEPGLRLVYGSISLLQSIFLAVSNTGLAILVIIAVAIVAIDVILLTLWLAAALVPAWRIRLFEAIKEMTRKILLPAVVIGVGLLGFKLVELLTSLLSGAGWLVVASTRAALTLGVIVYVGYKIISIVLKWNQERKARDALGDLDGLDPTSGDSKEGPGNSSDQDLGPSRTIEPIRSRG